MPKIPEGRWTYQFYIGLPPTTAELGHGFIPNNLGVKSQTTCLSRIRSRSAVEMLLC
jgi:hypothetical protein